MMAVVRVMMVEWNLVMRIVMMGVIDLLRRMILNRLRKHLSLEIRIIDGDIKMG
jgi:hypothetical protein